jgi:hypothetical protein
MVVPNVQCAEHRDNREVLESLTQPIASLQSVDSDRFVDATTVFRVE